MVSKGAMLVFMVVTVKVALTLVLVGVLCIDNDVDYDLYRSVAGNVYRTGMSMIVVFDTGVQQPTITRHLG